MQTLNTQQLDELRQSQSDIPLINVLPEKEYQQAHIPQSQNAPLGDDDFVSRVEQAAGGKEKPVVVYCASADCDASPKAAKKLDEAGFSKVYDYEGGTKAWHEDGREVRGTLRA